MTLARLPRLAEGTYVEGNADSGAEKRAGIFRHSAQPRSRIRGARGCGRRLRRAGCLRLQLRRPPNKTRPRRPSLKARMNAASWP